jgi:hypothetical protein
MKKDRWFSKGRRGIRYVKVVDVIKANSMIPESSSLSEHNNEEVEFHRWDLVVRYLALENHFSESDYGWEFFRKMRVQQSSEFGDGHRQTEYDQSARTAFEKLADNMKHQGYDKKYPIPVHAESLRLNDGGQRFVCALYFKLEKFPCVLDYFDPDVNYPINWFSEHGFEKEEIQLIKDGHIRMFEHMDDYIWE